MSEGGQSKPSGRGQRAERGIPWPLFPALAAAALLAGLALVVRGSLSVAFGERPLLILMVPPLILAAWLGGLWPGLLATAIIAAGTAFYFIPPAGMWSIEQAHDLAQWAMLVASGLLVSAVTESLHAARRRFAAEAEARERTAERLRTVLTGAQCILWHARVVGHQGWRDDPFNELGLMTWEFAIEDVTAADRVLALDVPPGESYTDAWLASRPERYRPGMRRMAFEALRSDAEGYQQTYPCLDRNGQERWLYEQVTIRPAAAETWDLVGVCTDITERLADAELRRAVLNQTRCILWQAEVTDPIHATRTAEDRATPLEWQSEILDLVAAQQVVPLAVPDGDSYLKTFQEFRDPSDRRMTHRTGLAAILDGEPSYGFDYRCTDRYGMQHWLREEATVIPLAPGRWRVFGICTDITGRKAAEEELRLVLTHARCILWSAEVSDPLGERRPPDDHVSELRWETRIAEEQAALQVLPLPLREGESFRSAFHRLRHPADKLLADAYARRAILTGEATYEQAFRCTDSAGRERWLHEEVVIVPGPAHHWHLYGVTTDITARKQAEEELRAVLTHARCILWRGEVTRRRPAAVGHELDWQVKVVDEDAARQILPLAVPPGRTFIQASMLARPTDDVDRTRQVTRAAILGGAPSYDLDYRCTDRHGTIHWIHEETVITPAGDGHWRLFGVSIDISDLKAAEDEVRALNSELEQRVADRTAELVAANEELEGFAYAVSHDLRAPLRAMSGFSNALVEDFHAALPEEARGYLQQIVQASQRMGALIDGLLVLSRATRGELQRDRIDLSAMAERLLTELAAAEPSREVVWEVQPGLAARGDTRMIEAVMRNLLSNAFKYTARTLDAHIRVGARDVGLETRYEIQDNGAGFDEAYAVKLFQPFQRLHRQDEFPGLGIGLATAQRIIRRHGGTLEAEGRVGHGATFAFTLPEAAESEPANEHQVDPDR